jgi:hypothetical protein
MGGEFRRPASLEPHPNQSANMVTGALTALLPLGDPSDDCTDLECSLCEEDPEEALSYRIMVARAALTKAAESAAKFKRPEIERSLRALANAVPRLEDQV